MNEIVLATTNEGKIKELQKLLSNLNLKFLSLRDYPEIQICEDGKTFEENAKKKAVLVAKHTGKCSLSDDSGLEVACLNGFPGIHSARWASTDTERNVLLLEMLKDIPSKLRQAKFVSVIAIASPTGKVELVRGECAGLIALEPEGTEGFGYDPIFFYPPYNKTFAQLGIELKNKISHRSIAINKACEVISRW